MGVPIVRRGTWLGRVVLLLAVMAVPAMADPAEWIDLSEGQDFDAWRPPTGEWEVVGDVALDPDDPRKLTTEPGTGVLVNGPTGRTRNLLTREDFGDIELSLEFLVPRGSNSGVKFQGLYEIQIHDSWGVDEVQAIHNGGIYPRAELLPRYRRIDDGFPPRTNASRPPGEWQTLHAIFQAPRFDDEGRKTANARFIKVVLNGELIHEDVEVPYPTGHAWRQPEVPVGPILLQADHGPVAFRNIRVRPWDSDNSK